MNFSGIPIYYLPRRCHFVEKYEKVSKIKRDSLARYCISFTEHSSSLNLWYYVAACSYTFKFSLVYLQVKTLNKAWTPMETFTELPDFTESRWLFSYSNPLG